METPFDTLLDSYFTAYSAHDAQGCAACFTEGGQIFHPWGATSERRDEIAALHNEWFAEGETNKTWAALYHQSEGDCGSCLLEFSSDMPDGSHVRGAALAAMERHASGWLMRVISLQMLPGGEDDPS